MNADGDGAVSRADVTTKTIGTTVGRYVLYAPRRNCTRTVVLTTAIVMLSVLPDVMTTTARLRDDGMRRIRIDKKFSKRNHQKLIYEAETRSLIVALERIGRQKNFIRFRQNPF